MTMHYGLRIKRVCKPLLIFTQKHCKAGYTRRIDSRATPRANACTNAPCEARVDVINARAVGRKPPEHARGASSDHSNKRGGHWSELRLSLTYEFKNTKSCFFFYNLSNITENNKTEQFN